MSATDLSERDGEGDFEELAVLKQTIRSSVKLYPDFPTPGTLFADILPLFASPTLHSSLVRALEIYILSAHPPKLTPPFSGVDIIVGLEARGFLFGPSLALKLGAGFVPVRKAGKLPGETVKAEYTKEYGVDSFEMQKDSIKPGQRVVIVDDIIATGGSAAAAGELVKKLGGELLEYIFILEVNFLKGRDKLDAPVYTILDGVDATTFRSSGDHTSPQEV